MLHSIMHEYVLYCEKVQETNCGKSYTVNHIEKVDC